MTTLRSHVHVISSTEKLSLFVNPIRVRLFVSVIDREIQSTCLIHLELGGLLHLRDAEHIKQPQECWPSYV